MGVDLPIIHVPFLKHHLKSFGMMNSTLTIITVTT